jgi:HK97 family phage major capsid protein
MKIKDLIEQRARNFEAMKKLNDKVLEEGRSYTAEETSKLERMDADHLDLSAKIENIQKQEQREIDLAMDVREAVRDERGEVKTEKVDHETAYREVFTKLLSGGISSLSAGERKVVDSYRTVMNITTPAQGGYVVPVSYATTVIKKLYDENVMRRLGKVIKTQSTTNIPLEDAKATFTWTGENVAYTETNPTFSQVVLGAYKNAGIVKVSEELMSDSFIDLEAYITDQIVMGAGDNEEQAFVVGTGTAQPTGILTSATLGKTTASSTAIIADEVLDLIYSVKAGYAKKGTLLMHRSTELAIRKLKDSNGQYLWQPSLQAGTPNLFDGKPVETSEYVPLIGTGNKIMAFGDFSYFNIADRGDMYLQRLNERYAELGQVGFRAYMRVDSKLTQTEAVKYMKNA